MRAGKDAISPNHYSRFIIQPIEFILKNSLSYCQGNVIKYVCRYNHKNGIEDLEKARRYIDYMIEDLKNSHNNLELNFGTTKQSQSDS